MLIRWQLTEIKGLARVLKMEKTTMKTKVQNTCRLRGKEAKIMMLARDLFREMDALRHEIDRAFQDFDKSWAHGGRSRIGFLPGRSARSYPLINLTEDENGLMLEALAPGIDPENLSVAIQGNTLTIAGEKKAVHPDVKVEAFHRNERAAGRFVRNIELPVPIDAEKISADYRQGILHITLPKSVEAKPKRIEVNVV